MNESLPNVANTNEVPQLSIEAMEAAIAEAGRVYGALQEKFADKDFYGADAVAKKRELDSGSAALAEILKTQVPDDQRAKNRLPDLPQYEGPPLVREEFPSEPPQQYVEILGYKPPHNPHAPKVDERQF